MGEPPLISWVPLLSRSATARTRARGSSSSSKRDPEDVPACVFTCLRSVAVIWRSIASFLRQSRRRSPKRGPQTRVPRSFPHVKGRYSSPATGSPFTTAFVSPSAARERGGRLCSASSSECEGRLVAPPKRRHRKGWIGHYGHGVALSWMASIPAALPTMIELVVSVASM